MKYRTGHLFKRNGIYYVQWRVNGKLFMRSTGERNLKDAEARRAEIMAPFITGDEVAILQNVAARIEGKKAEITARADKDTPPLPLEGAWRSFLAANRPDSGEATLDQYECQFSIFKRWMEKEHPETTALRDVTKRIAEEFAAHLTKEGRSPNTFNKYMNLLQMVFRVLKDKAKLVENPWEGIQRRRLVTQSRRELTTDELKKVCGEAQGEIRLLFALGVYTGLRLGDCATLRWGEVDLRRNRIARIPNKIARSGPKPVVIPIHPVLHAMLSETAPSNRGEYVLPALAGQYVRSRAHVTEVVQRHFANCGIRTSKETTKGRARVEVGFHSLRHTFVSMCREANAPLSVVEAIVGHSNPAMTRHYTHVSELAASQAVTALPDIINRAKIVPSSLPKFVEAAPIRALAETLTPGTAEEIKRRLLAILA